MTCRAFLYIACIVSVCAYPKCDLFDDDPYYQYRFHCKWPLYINGVAVEYSVWLAHMIQMGSSEVETNPFYTCQLESNWDWEKRMVVDNMIQTVSSFDYSSLPNKPVRWLCPKNGQSMPEFDVFFESMVRDRPFVTKVTLHQGSPSGRIENVNADDFPMSSNCVEEYKIFNKNSRENRCWKFREMPHFSEQFPQLNNFLQASPSPQTASVRECRFIDNKGVRFQKFACVVPGTRYVYLRPKYKFYKDMTGKPGMDQTCTIVIQPFEVKEYIENYYSGVSPTFEQNLLEYLEFPTLQGNGVSFRDISLLSGYTKCTNQRFVMGGLFESTGNTYMSSVGEISDGKIQPVHARTSRNHIVCPDFVSQACFYNSYSFYARPCVWYQETNQGVLFSSLIKYMESVRESDKWSFWDTFRTYGDGLFEFEMNGFNLQVSITRNSGGGRLVLHLLEYIRFLMRI